MPDPFTPPVSSPFGVTPPTRDPVRDMLLLLGSSLLGAGGQGTSALNLIGQQQQRQAQRQASAQAMQAASILSRLETEDPDRAEQYAFEAAQATAESLPAVSQVFLKRVDTIREKRLRARSTEAALGGIERAVTPPGSAIPPAPAGVSELLQPSTRALFEGAIREPAGAAGEALQKFVAGARPERRTVAGVGEVEFDPFTGRRTVVEAAVAAPGQPTKLTADQISGLRSLGFKVETDVASQLPQDAAIALRNLQQQERVERTVLAGIELGQSVVYDTRTAQPAADFDPRNLGPGKAFRAVPVATHNQIADLDTAIPQVQLAANLARRVLGVAPGQNLRRALEALVQRGLASSADLALFEGITGPLSLQLTRIYQGARPSDLDLEAVLLLIPRVLTDTGTTAAVKLQFLVETLEAGKRAKLGLPFKRVDASPEIKRLLAQAGGGIFIERNVGGGAQ